MSGCATYYPRDKAGRVVYHLEHVRKAIERDEGFDVASHLGSAIDNATDFSVISKFLSETNDGGESCAKYMAEYIAELNAIRQIEQTSVRLEIIQKNKIFSDKQRDGLYTSLSHVVSDGNKNGRIAFELGDERIFPLLASPEHQKIMLQRTIKNLQTPDYSERKITQLMEYVSRIGKDSIESKKVAALLSTLNIKASELDAVSNVFPHFSAIRQAEAKIHVVLSVSKADALFEDDVLNALQADVKGVEWGGSVGAHSIELNIERLRFDEKISQEKQQTIVYSNYQVNALSAALLMPKNASYLFDLYSGGAEIEYGFLISASSGKKPLYKELVRGRVNESYQRCQNYRVQNVFGGITSANFVANQDMESKCAGQTSLNLEYMRKEVMSKIVDVVKKIPPIQRAHSFY